MNGVLPERSPRVIVGPDRSTEKTIAICRVPECRWSYANVVKSDVMEHARHHREHHRAAAAEATS